MIEKSEIQNKVENYLSNTIKVATANQKIIDFIFHTPLEILVPELGSLPPASVYSVLSNKTDYVKTVIGLDFQSAFPFDTLAEGMDKETEKAIADFVYSIEIKPSKKLLTDLIKQKAIQDLIANIIESGIIEFNKKTNPLFGMIQATGLDKQIKSFINMFLPNFLPQIADFLYTTSLGPNSTLAKDISFLVMNAPLAELQLPNDNQMSAAEEKLKTLRERLVSDTKLQNTLRKFYSTIKKRFLEKYGKENLKQFLHLSEEDYEQFKVTTSEYVAQEVVRYHTQNPLGTIVVDIISDILA
jgi:hypothetical protein